MGGGGSASKTAKGGEWNVNDFNLTGTEKQIKYARDLIQRQYDGLLAGEKEYRRKADEYRKKVEKTLPQATINKQILYTAMLQNGLIQSSKGSPEKTAIKPEM